jgi:hypothetical protein
MRVGWIRVEFALKPNPKTLSSSIEVCLPERSRSIIHATNTSDLIEYSDIYLSL